MADPHVTPPSSPSPSLRQAEDFPREVLRLFDRYVHGDISRRDFLAGAARHATVGVSALAFLEALSPRFARAQQVAPDDSRIRAEHVEFESPRGHGKGRGYLVRPAAASGKLPGVLVVHENRGLNPHIEDIARRVALADFVAFAPDALFPLGGYPGDEDKARALFGQLEQPKAHEDFVAAAAMLRSHAAVTGRIGVVGFCYGGGIANLLATRLPELRAAVPFYGRAPAAADVPDIRAEMQIHYASNDERTNAGWPAYEAALKAARVRYEAFFYPNTEHAFNNDTTPRYNAEAAKLAWQRTIDLFNRTLRG